MTIEDTKPKAPRYRVLVGINFPDGKGERRCEPGEILTAADLKRANLAWYQEIGAVEKIGGD
jgi:hypothetical protein